MVKIVVGLGNPGTQYENTRHNLGFRVVDALGRQEAVPLGRRGFASCLGKGTIAGAPILLAKPQTYMNRSGLAVRELLAFHRIAPEDLLVVHDDLDLPPGTVRLKRGGGAGGHKGLLSILDELNADAFGRVRLGIGRPPRKEFVESYVLSAFPPEEAALVPSMIDTACRAVVETIRWGMEAAMNTFHRRQA